MTFLIVVDQSKTCTQLGRLKPRSHTARCRAATRVAAVVEHIVLTSLFIHRAATRVAAASMTLKLNWFNFSVILTRVAAR